MRLSLPRKEWIVGDKSKSERPVKKCYSNPNDRLQWCALAAEIKFSELSIYLGGKTTETYSYVECEKEIKQDSKILDLSNQDRW